MKEIIKSILVSFLILIYIFLSLYKIEDSNIIRITKTLEYKWELKLNKSKKWKRLPIIPYDFSLLGKFDVKNETKNSSLPSGVAIYRKYLKLPKVDRKFTAIVYFYGAYKDTYVYVNNIYVGENHYGYNSFSFDITKYLKLNGKVKNIIEVRVKDQNTSSRWYSGSGLFRKVELIICNPIHFEVDGVYITTPDIKEGKGTVKVEAEINNRYNSRKKIGLNLIVKDTKGKKIASQKSKKEEIIESHSTKLVSSNITVKNPLLWSDIKPNLYVLEVEIIINKTVVDKVKSNFGFRYFHFDGDKGFFINGKPRKIHGVSLHHDYGAIGSIDNYDAALKRFTQLKEMGINAIRTTHNTPHKTWIDLADKLGIYIIEEFFDVWTQKKNRNKNDFSEYFNKLIYYKNKIIGGKKGMTWSDYVVKSTIKRDRNSPSIIMWSLGNEIIFDKNSPKIVKNMISWARLFDDSRLFTIGENKVVQKLAGIPLEVCKSIVSAGGLIGYNYGNMTEIENGANIFGALYLSETTCSLNSRGIYSLIEDGGKRKHDGEFHLTSYDVSYSKNGAPVHTALWRILVHDFIPAQFVSTGFDYIGELTNWTGVSGSKTGKDPIINISYKGFFDTAGFPKDSYYLYRAHLRKDSFIMHIVSAWDKDNICFTEKNTTKTPVHIYTNVPLVELYRSDKTDPICSVNRTLVKTDNGFEYQTFNVVSHDDICQGVEPTDEDEGSNLFGRFTVEFKEGTQLYLKGYDLEGKRINIKKVKGRTKVSSPNKKKLKLDVVCDKKVIKADGKSLAFVEVSIVDDQGMLNTKGENLISFSLKGKGKILGVDNGDQVTVDKYQQSSELQKPKYAAINAFAGKALAIIRSTWKTGKISLTISSEGFKNKTIEISTKY